jgi:hypothetical protein
MSPCSQVPNLPAKGVVVFKYKSTDDSGAVLITKTPVHRDAFYHESPFTRWVKSNSVALMRHARKDEIKKYGLTIITDVYSTKRCSLTAWRGTSKTVQAGFNVTAEGLLDVGFDSSWYVNKTAGAWNHYAGEKVSISAVDQ